MYDRKICLMLYSNSYFKNFVTKIHTHTHTHPHTHTHTHSHTHTHKQTDTQTHLSTSCLQKYHYNKNAKMLLKLPKIT